VRVRGQTRQRLVRTFAAFATALQGGSGRAARVRGRQAAGELVGDRNGPRRSADAASTVSQARRR